MTAPVIIFYIFAGTAALAAFGILFSKNVFKAALFLLACLLAVAALYVFAFAEFVAVTQVLIYAGGILVVIIFGIMITSKLSGKPLQVTNNNAVSGLSASIVLFGLLVYFISHDLEPMNAASLPVTEPVESIGLNLMTTFSLPFELTGVLLLAALVGAAVMTSFTKTKNS
jgi:NADH:ubiquinone oxidoreductase subunit 6 (subunit J)